MLLGLQDSGASPVLLRRQSSISVQLYTRYIEPFQLLLKMREEIDKNEPLHEQRSLSQITIRQSARRQMPRTSYLGHRFVSEKRARAQQIRPGEQGIPS